MSKIVYESEGEIVIEGCPFTVKYNLHDALDLLHAVASKGNDTMYFWIDALCMDQKNAQERTAQVSIMDKIYMGAERVIVWLGQEDEFTSDALLAIESLGSLPTEAHSRIKPGDWTDQDRALRGVGAKPLHWRNWLALLAFFNRPYFARIWIVQELTLSRDAAVYCGPRMLPFSWIMGVMAFLLTTGWNMYTTVLYFRDIPEFMAASRWSSYKNVLQDVQLSMLQPLAYIHQLRSQMRQTGYNSPLYRLLQFHRISDSSDPRDKIYGLLGMAWKDVPPFLTHSQAMSADYTISPKDAFVKFTRTMIDSHSNLHILRHVEPTEKRLMFDLPSWVPDYSAKVPVNYLCGGGSKDPQFDASKGFPFAYDHRGTYDNTLKVHGYQLSTVAAAAKTFPADTWGGAFGQLDPQHTTILGFACQVGEAQMRTLPSSATRAEILWRTFCGDLVTQGEYPAAPDIAEQFFRFVTLSCLAKAYIYEENYLAARAETAVPDEQKWWKKYMKPLRELFGQEPLSSPMHIDKFDATFNAAILLPYTEDVLSWIPSSYNRWWFGVQNHHAGRRRHFQDSDQRYLMGPIYADVGDEIWIVAGMSTPCMLRKMEDGKYQYLGEAYIHGIMNGELADHGLLQPTTDIELV